MKRIQSLLPFVALFGIGVFALITRLYRLELPAEFVFDERYHVPAVRLMAENDPRAFEWWHGPIYGFDNHDWLHPPLAKYIQALFFQSFGHNAFAWRLPSAVFGVIGVALVFVVAQLAFRKISLSLLAALLLSLDGLWLVQSRVAMNDVFVTVWLLAAIASYLWYRRSARAAWLLPVGILGGLGLATKWSAVFWLVGLLIWEMLGMLQKRTLKKIPWLIFSLIVVPGVVYVASFTPMFLQGKDFRYFIELQTNIVRYELLLQVNHPDQSVPWQWPLNLTSVWYWHGVESSDIYAFNNPLLAWFEFGAVWFALSVLWRTKRKKLTQTLGVVVMIFAVVFLPWLASPRLLFYYHYTPATPFAAILLAYWWHEIYLRAGKPYFKAAFFVALTSLVWVFWLYYPRWIGLPVTSAFSQTVWLLPLR